MTWVLDLIRMLLSVLDRMVYGLIQVFYTAFVEISQVRVFQDDVLQTISNRIYTFLALIMLFKLAFSIITYIINPDNFSNSEKGMGKVIQNVIIMLVLLVAMPYIFAQAYKLQAIVIKSNLIPKVILGTGENSDLLDSSVYKSMSFTVLNAFLKPNTSGEIKQLTEGPKCNGISMFDENGQFNAGFASCMNNLSEQTAQVPTAGKMTIANSNETVPVTVYAPKKMGDAYKYAYENNDYNRLIDLITAKYKDNGDVYLFDYTYLISTIAGGFVAWILLIFCFDIAVRTVKFSFLQLIAPIPIISYIDPKSGKNGMFQKWVKTCLSTYADLFIRLIAIYFAVFIVSVVSDFDQIYYVDKSLGTPSPIIKVFVIIGALMFAKQVPKLIEDITGIKLSGDFTLNPLKKIGQSPLAAAAIGGAGAMVGGAAANLYNGIREGRGVRRTLGSTIGGATSGLFRGIHAGATGRGKDNVLNAAGHGMRGSINARNLRTARRTAGDGGIPGVIRRAGVGINNLAGVESGASKFDKQVSAYDKFLKEYSDLETYVEKELAKGKGGQSVSGEWTDVDGNKHNFSGLNLNVLKNRVEALKQSGTATAEDITNADYLYHAALNQAKQDYIRGNSSDATIKSMLSNMDYIRQQNETLAGFSDMPEIKDAATWNDDTWDNAKKAIKNAKADVISSSAYRQEQLNRRNDANNRSNGGR